MVPTMNQHQALIKAITAAGGPAQLARTLGLRRQSVHGWGKNLPAKRAVEVEAACGGVVTREQLRPDLYPTERPRRKR